MVDTDNTRRTTDNDRWTPDNAGMAQALHRRAKKSCQILAPE